MIKNISTKIAATAATSAALSVAIAFSTNNPAQALTLNYSYLSDTGYSAIGQFSYDETTAPATISEAGIGPTNALESLSLSVFDPSGNLLDSGNSVVNSVSNDQFLVFEFDTLTKTLTAINTSTESSGNEPYYFLSNNLDPSGNNVPAGNTTFNLFSYAVSTDTLTFLGSAPSVQVSSTPEPASVLSLLALGMLGAGSAFKKKKV